MLPRWALLTLFSVLGGCGAATPAAPANVGSTPAPTGAGQPSAGFCTVDLTFGGGIDGRVTGSQNGRAKFSGPTASDIGISLFFAVPVADSQGFIDLKVFQLDGTWVTLGRTDTGDLGLWRDGQGGSVSIAKDGSTASLDVTVTGANIRAPVHVAGTITCPPAPPPGR